MLAVLGLTSEAKIHALRPRFDAVASSARFFAPERGRVDAVAGCFRYSGGTNAVSIERSLYFDGAGRFSRSGFVGVQATDLVGRPRDREQFRRQRHLRSVRNHDPPELDRRRCLLRPLRRVAWEQGQNPPRADLRA